MILAIYLLHHFIISDPAKHIQNVMFNGVYVQVLLRFQNPSASNLSSQLFFKEMKWYFKLVLLCSVELGNSSNHKKYHSTISASSAHESSSFSSEEIARLVSANHNTTPEPLTKYCNESVLSLQYLKSFELMSLVPEIFAIPEWYLCETDEVWLS